MSVPADAICARYYFSGRVQGVGFRAVVRRCAIAQAVSGWVKNLPDGRVEVLAAGSPAALALFLSKVRSVMAGAISQEVYEPVCGLPPEPGFSIVG